MLIFFPPRQHHRLRAGVRDLNGDVRQGFIVLEPLPIERAVAGFVREHRHHGAQVSRIRPYDQLAMTSAPITPASGSIHIQPKPRARMSPVIASTDTAASASTCM